jgi:hypothetical protein
MEKEPQPDPKDRRILELEFENLYLKQLLTTKDEVIKAQQAGIDILISMLSGIPPAREGNGKEG